MNALIVASDMGSQVCFANWILKRLIIMLIEIFAVYVEEVRFWGEMM
jgi:hypothetical protein